jgi:hypothetical protein
MKFSISYGSFGFNVKVYIKFCILAKWGKNIISASFSTCSQVNKTSVLTKDSPRATILRTLA